jgi:hypothetical protein
MRVKLGTDCRVRVKLGTHCRGRVESMQRDQDIKVAVMLCVVIVKVSCHQIANSTQETENLAG